MIDHATEVIDLARQAVLAGDEEGVRAAMLDLGFEVLRENRFPEPLFTPLLELLAEESTRTSPAGWVIWKQLQEEWEFLADDQRERLRRAADEAFDASAVWLWSFMIVSLLAEQFADRGALDSFRRFRERTRPHARALLPDALRTLAKWTKDEEVRETARREVEVLAKDSDPAVQQEATNALARWKG